jgi:hypothetical protein
MLGLAAALTLFSGCTTIAIDPTLAGRPTVIKEADKMPEVRLSAAMLTLEDPVKDFGNTYQIQSAKVFRAVFTGGEEAPYVLDLVNHSVAKQSSDVMLLGTSTQITYTISVVLRRPDGTKQTFNSTGSASTAWTLDRAMREALERAAIDLAAQIRAVTSP